MIRWIPYTFVRTVLFFIGGILAAMEAPDLIPEPLAVLVLVSGVVVYLSVVFFKFHRRYSFNPGWIALPLVFLSGYLHLVRQMESRDPGHLLNIQHPFSYYQAVISGFGEEKANSWKFEARILQVHDATWKPAKGKVLLYFPKADFSGPFHYGDVLLIRGQPQVPDGPGNPGEFDYREYLRLRNIYHQHFVSARDLVLTGHHPPSALMAYAFRSREWAESTLKRFVHGQREQAIAAALVLGITDGLDNELLNAYAATGSMHILAVSGLHVGILYFVLLFILSPLKRARGGRWIVPFTSLLIMWLYAFITGCPASVLRAVSMFSFMAIARPWARRTNVYNTLAVSAFCLLLFDPFLVRSVGFQLSFLAVLGIVYLYPRLLVLWEPKSMLLTEVWKILVVSIAAQTATFSLGLFYFHQFPNFFLLSNLLVVPLASVILILGVAVLGMSFFSVAASAVGFCLERVIRFVNYVVFTLESIPFSLIENVYISFVQCALLILFLVNVLALARYRKFQYVLTASFVILSFASLQWWHFSEDVNVAKITVYRVPGHCAIDLIDRGHTFFLTDTVLEKDIQKIRYHVNPNRLIAGVGKISEDFQNVRAFKGCSILAWHGVTILYITDRHFEIPPSLAVDLLIIGNDAVSGIESVLGKVVFEKLVLDSSNSFFFARRFLEDAKLHNLDVYSVLHRGAFISAIENHNS